MNAVDYIHLLNRPNAIRETHLSGLDRIVEEFPYFQSARALQLKCLYNLDSFKYNQALKTTAAYTTDRSVLFDFITSGQFNGLQQAFLEEKQAKVNEIMVTGDEIISVKTETKANTLEQSILTSIKESSPAVGDEAANRVQETIEEKLEIGKPLIFSREETHSFGEWLQLASIRPIEREPVSADSDTAGDLEKKKKTDLIDRFIETNPKISPIRNTDPVQPVPLMNTDDNSYLMTETLAKVYLEQKKYQKAIQAYEILILKYPEKSSLFADRISDIKILQQNNN